MQDNIVVVENLSVIFNKFYAVRNVSFSVRKGEIFGFLGANGAGKTTTIRVLCGLLVPSLGNVYIDNEKLVTGDENRIKKNVGYMSQKFTLYDDLTIDENLSFSSSLRGISNRDYKERLKYLFNFIGFDRDTNIIVRDLPGGLKQEIALISSLLHDPKIIFLDEPTAGVSPMSRVRFWDLIKKLSDLGKTIFVTTHYMDEAENCHRIALMRSGEMIALDTPQNLKKSTYSEQIYHITPKSNDSLKKLTDISKGCFAMFEPYGHHFHAIIKNECDANKVIDDLSQIADIKKIDPSLEDVFVRLVEGDSR